MMKAMVINCGSSTIKYQLFDMRDRSALATGLVENIGEPTGRLHHSSQPGHANRSELSDEFRVPNHHAGLDWVAKMLAKCGDLPDESDLSVVGHRVVHGGEFFHGPTLLTDDALEQVRRLSPLAPLHNPANLLGVEVAASRFPHVPQVAVFDTAFHQTIPEYAYRYAVPDDVYQQHGVRRYGFHGTSHFHVTKQAARVLNRPLEEINLITLHLGNGASACAVRGGKSVDTSMGLTPLEGLVMGTRSGDLDPAVVFHLIKQSGCSADDVDQLLNRQSGLKGLCGSNDMREVIGRADEGDGAAQRALQVYCYRLKKYIGAYTAALGCVDALVFTAGVGENSPRIRAECCAGLGSLGFAVDESRNQHPTANGRIHADSSSSAILVIPTNEELEIAEQAIQFARGAKRIEE